MGHGQQAGQGREEEAELKTARFREVVARAGHPAVHLAWSGPAKDAALKRAAAEHRVLTVHQQLHGGKKDFGEVGLVTGPGGQHLIFPKSLRAFVGRKVVGVEYGLVDGALGGSARSPRTRKAAAPPRKAKAKEEASEAHGHVGKSRTPRGPAKAPPEKQPEKERSPQRPALTLEEVRHEVARALRDLRSRKAAEAEARLAALLET